MTPHAWATFGKGVLYLVALVAISVLYGFTFLTLWGWFAVPLGAPPISIGEALGISLTVTFLTSTTRPDDRNIGQLLVASVVKSVLALAFGALYAAIR